MKTGLSGDILRSIWNLSCFDKSANGLSKLEFFLALKYIALAQASEFGNPNGSEAYQQLKKFHLLLALPVIQSINSNNSNV